MSIRELESGVLVRQLPLATVVVRGPDRVTWLNGMVTSDLSKLRAGDASYGLFVAKNGKIQSELYALLGPEDTLLGVHRDRAAGLVESLDRYLVMEDAEIGLSDIGEAWFLVLGPKTSDAVAAARAAGARAGTIQRRSHAAAAVACAPDQKDAVIAALAALGAAPMGDIAWASARVMLGIPEHGVDFDDANYPQEAALERDAVSFQKGCYLGQEAVFMLENRGHVKKRLVQLDVDGAVAVGDAITTPDGAEIGKVTSALAEDTKAIALGYVKYKQAAAKTELRVAGHVARVTELMSITPE